MPWLVIRRFLVDGNTEDEARVEATSPSSFDYEGAFVGMGLEIGTDAKEVSMEEARRLAIEEAGSDYFEGLE